MSADSGDLKKGLKVFNNGIEKVVKDWFFQSAPAPNNDEIVIKYEDGSVSYGLNSYSLEAGEKQTNEQDYEDESRYLNLEDEEATYIADPTFIDCPELRNAKVLSMMNPEGFTQPSRSQMERLAPGDHVQVCADGERFWVKVLWIRGGGGVGMIDNELGSTAKHGMSQGDTIAFHKDHVYKVLPWKERPKFQSYVVMSTTDFKDRVHVMHTRYPRMIAAIFPNGKNTRIVDIEWLDEPLDYVNESPLLLNRIVIWFLKTYLNIDVNDTHRTQ